MSTIGLVSLGCAKNLVNSEQMLYLLQEAGFEIVPTPDDCDVAIVNTCGFIEAAKTEAIDEILRLGELKSEGRVGKIIVAGCLSQRYRDEMLSEFPEVDVIVGVGSFAEIAEAAEAALAGERRVFAGDVERASDDLPRVVTTPSAWAYLKIADGCDNRCAFCVIPSIRGGYRSRAMESVIEEARDLTESGVRELILIAQDTTRYGLDLYGERRLPALLRELEKLPNLRWLRLHYLYPDEIDETLLDTIAESDKILRYFDVPIQHISNTILKTMRRRGTAEQVRGLIARLRARFPDGVIRTSLIAGLPGEGEREFEELCDFLREAKLERAGVFVYSPEEGTAAAEMERPDADVASRRAELAVDIQSRVMDDFNARRVGTEVDALVEDYDEETAEYLARTYAESPDVDGTIRVRAEGLAIGEFITIRIIAAEDGIVTAIPV
ncbi:MAG: 30S ribosomal protein S12 methylthiotransferase RimO [Oscillospiraceae bacterium]|nr:30S ribosomal protein S12 methylthiotransferase RimO [Oscillospiraceae bacterium]